MGCGMVKEKPTLLLMERLQRPQSKQRDGWLALKRENRALLCGTTLVIFGTHLFPGGHEGRVWVPKPHAEEGTLLVPPLSERDEPTLQQLGAWRVRLSRLAEGVSNTKMSGSSSDGSAGRGSGGGGGGGGGRNAMPEVAWQIVGGLISYVLPGQSAYAVGSSTVAQVDALRTLKGETWDVLLGSFPQIVPAGEAQGGDVLVELECMPRSECNIQVHGGE